MARHRDPKPGSIEAIRAQRRCASPPPKPTLPPLPPMPSPPCPVAEMVSPSDVDRYRKELGSYLQEIEGRVRHGLKYGPAYDGLMTARATTTAAIAGCRARANALAIGLRGARDMPTMMAPREAVEIIRELLEIIDRCQDTGVSLTDEEVGRLDGAAGWVARITGQGSADADGAPDCAEAGAA